MIYLQLFLAFVQIGLLSIGGGYAAMPLIENQTVVLHNWLTMEEFADIVTIAEMTPGPIALNAATFVGIRIAGLPGALVATFGCVLPCAIIVFTLAYIYTKFRSLKVFNGILNGVRPAVIALIASAGLTLLCMCLYGSRTVPTEWLSFDYISIIVVAISLVVLRIWKVNPIYVIFGSGIVSAVAHAVVM